LIDGKLTDCPLPDLGDLFMGIFGKGRGKVQVVEGVDVYLMLVFSCQELPQIEELETLVKAQVEKEDH
jgi:hypothetical protein